MLTHILQRALISAQNNDMRNSKRSVLQALAQLEEIDFNELCLAVSQLQQPSSTEEKASSGSSELIERANRLIHDLELSAKTNSVELTQLQQKLTKQKGEAEKQWAQFNKVDRELKELDQTMSKAIDIRRKHQLTISSSIEGLSYPQLVEQDVQKTRARLQDLNDQLSALLTEADQVLTDHIKTHLDAVHSLRQRFRETGLL